MKHTLLLAAVLGLSCQALANEPHVVTVQVDFQRTLSEREVRTALRAFDLHLVRASNGTSRSQRWLVDVQTRLSDYKLRSELQRLPGVRSVRFVKYHTVGTGRAAA